MGFVTHFTPNPPSPLSIASNNPSPTPSNFYPLTQAYYKPNPGPLDAFPYNYSSALSPPQLYNHSNQAQKPARQQRRSMDSAPERKTHSSCDPCRSRKLKCSGERTGCERCRREGLNCIYSLQKQMGRPRKRQRSHDESAERSGISQQSAAAQFHSTSTASSFNGLSTPPLAENEYATSTSSGNYLNPSESWPTPKSYGSGVRSSVGSQQQAYQSNFHDFSWSANVSHNEPISLPDPSIPSSFSTYQEPTFSYTSGPSSPSQVNPTATYSSAVATGDAIDHDDEPACSCLPNMYLAAAEMQNSRGRGFPFAIQPIRAALSTTYNMLVCPVCPLHMASARQSIMLVSTLLMSIIGEVDKLLRNIDKEALRAQQQGRRKTFRVGDNAHREYHTGTPDCPAAFEVELDPSEWRVLAKRAIAKLIFASCRSNANTPTPGPSTDVQDMSQPAGLSMTLDGLIASFEERQASWHRNPPAGLSDINHPTQRDADDSFTCIKLAREARRQVEMLNLN